MRLAIVAHRSSQTNDELLAAGDALGIHTVQLTPREALHSLRPDVAVARLDVRETCDGIEDGMRELEKLAAAPHSPRRTTSCSPRAPSGALGCRTRTRG